MADSKMRSLAFPLSWLIGHKKSLIADKRGAAALEGAIVILFLVTALLFPLVDLGIAGFQFISAHQALRDMAQLTQYSPPGDVTNATSITNWKSSLPTTVAGYTVTAQVYCINPVTLAPTPAPCAADTPGTPSSKYYTFTTSFTLSPMLLASVLCSTCPVSYSQPFQ
jgi:Flp pilus assembly protein TadG